MRHPPRPPVEVARESQGISLVVEGFLEAHVRMGDVEAALALARKHTRKEYLYYTARILALAGRWEELPSVLAPLSAPPLAAKTAWSMFLTITDGDF